jgi:hypothetical protein
MKQFTQDPAYLRKLLDLHLNINDIKNICYDLNIDYEDLSGDRKSDKIRELLQFCHRHGRIQDLIAKLANDYPNVKWKSPEHFRLPHYLKFNTVVIGSLFLVIIIVIYFSLEQQSQNRNVFYEFSDVPVPLHLLQVYPLSAPINSTSSIEKQRFYESITTFSTKSKGQVLVINTITQPFPIPKGTIFVAKNSANEDVIYLSEKEAVIPAAEVITSPNGRTTTYGRSLVTITSNTSGARSRAAANSIYQVIIPGQVPITVKNSNLLIRHDLITGGEDRYYFVKNPPTQDQQWLINQALSDLSKAADQELQLQLNRKGDDLRLEIVYPDLNDLTNSQKYQIAPTSQNSDTNTYSNITVRSMFYGIATPKNNPLGKQLTELLPEILFMRRDLLCSPDNARAIINHIDWNGSILSVSGSVRCQ